ncbi:MAG: hypothetical protein NTX49_01540 [Chlamydiae bacterium]|nr:hypothetical protein [Chlamydiota bacterium]
MAFDVTIRNVTSQLDQLESLYPVSPKAAKTVINDLQIISERISNLLRSGDRTPGEMLSVQIQMSRISLLLGSIDNPIPTFNFKLHIQR